MADGSSRPIADVNVGDLVKARDPESGESGESGESTSEPVTELHINIDHEFSDVTVVDEDGVSSTLHSTQNHPFYNDTDKTWTDAKDLTPGTKLKVEGTGTVTVTEVTNREGTQEMRDLTVAYIHTYDVLAGTTPVLVHNCGGGVNAKGKPCECGGGSIDPNLVRFSQSSVSPQFSNGMTIEHTAAGLRSGWIDPTDIPAVRLMVRNGNLFSLDNRRLVAFQKAGVQMPFRMATPEEIAAEGRKFTTKTEGKSITVNTRDAEEWPS